VYNVAVRIAALLVLLAAACGHDHGPPRVQKRPKPDGSAPLRGGGPPRSPRNASYKIEARLDVQRHTITASETLTWKNIGGSPVDSLPFHLYLNAFKNEKSLFWRTSHGAMRGAHASDTGWGWIQVESVQIDGIELVTKLHYTDPDDQTVAELPLDKPVAPGETIQVSFKFTDQLPEVYARTGYKGDFHMVGQWFPKIGVRAGPPGEEHWECKPFYATTEFFADFGTYDVALTVPSTHQVAATGVLVSANDLAGNMRTLVYRAEDVHDFAWMADPYMRMYSGTAKLEHNETVEVRVWARPEQEAFAQRHRDAAIGAIERFSADFTPYPWPIMTIIDPPPDAAAGAGGMEYPTLVTTGGDSVFMRPGIRLPEYITIHEVGHNWFQGMLASNEADEAWLDEGVNEWADAHVMTELYGPRRGIDWLGWQAELSDVFAAYFPDRAGIPSPIATAAYAFVDTEAYGAQSYANTQRALATLEQMVGSTKMMAAMRAYTNAWSFKHPTGRDLFAALAQGTGKDLESYIAQVFEQVGGVALAVRSATCAPAHPPRGIFDDGSDHKLHDGAETGSWQCEVVVQNTGTVHVPVDVELRFADGSSERRSWDGLGAWKRIEIERSAKLVEVVLDPDHVLALDSPLRHDERIEGDGAASLRAAARISSWAQTLMQLEGP